MLTSKHVIGVCASLSTAALIVVGVASGEIARHVLQTLPLWPAAILGLKANPAAKWSGAPVFLFWLLVMVLIWAYLLGLSRIASGTYGPIEIAMTLVIGAASSVGLGASVSFHSAKLRGILGGAVLFFVQVACMAVALHPPFENDHLFLDWIMK